VRTRTDPATLTRELIQPGEKGGIRMAKRTGSNEPTSRTAAAAAVQSRKEARGVRLKAATLGVWLPLAGAAVAAGIGALVSKGVGANTPHRDEYWNIRGGWALYLFLAALTAILLYVPFRRLRLYHLGRRDNRLNHWPARLRNAIGRGLSTHRVVRDRYT